jgi:hypothetical protein
LVPKIKSRRSTPVPQVNPQLVPGPLQESSDFQGYQLAAWQLKVHSSLISSVLQPARKVVTTEDWQVRLFFILMFQLARDEYRQLKLHNKVENMKASNTWSFRQLQAHVAPPRPKNHHDFLLEEMVKFCLDSSLEMDE